MPSRYAVATGNFNATATWSATDGGAPGASAPIDGDAVFLTALSGVVTVTVNVSSACTSLTCTGYTGTFAGSSALQIKGNIVAVAGMTWTYSGVITAALTAGTATLTSAGKTLCSGLTMNGAGGTLTFADAFVTTGTCTLTAGTWNDGNVNLTMGAWDATGGATRVITFGNGNSWFINGSGTVWKATGAGLSYNTLSSEPTCSIDFNYAGVSARVIEYGAWIPHIKVSAGSGTVLFDDIGLLSSVACSGLDFTGYSGSCTFDGTAVSSVTVRGGNLVLSASPATFANAGGWNIYPTAVHPICYITCNGQTLPGTACGFGHETDFFAAGSIVFLDNFASASAVTALNGMSANNFNFSAPSFSSSTTKTRTITMGSGTWTLTSTAATTVWNMATTTGLTLNANTATISLSGVTASTRTISANSVLLPAIAVNAGSGAVTFTNVNCNGLTFGNSYSGTIANQTITNRGSVQLSNHASFALTAGANAWTLAATATGQTITSQGKTCDFPLTFNGVGGGWTFADALVHGITRTLTLTNGALSFGTGLTHTMGFFASSNANVRTIDSGTSTLNFPTTGTVWDTSTSTNLTMAGTGTIALTANSATARTITGGSALLPSLSMATGSYAPTFTSCNFLGLTVTSGYTGTMANQAITLRGNVSLAATGAVYSAGSNAWTWANTSGTVTWASNGRSLDFPITVNGVGGTHAFADALVHGITRTLTLTNGTLSFGTALTHTMGFLSSANANVRTIDSGTSTLNFPTTGTVWDTSTSTNLTMAGTGTIALTANSATVRTITGGSALLPSLSMATGSFAPTFTSCNFLNITITSGYTGTLSNQAITLRGNVSLAATGAVYSAGSNAWTWANTSGTVTWASNGRSLDFPITVNGSATHQLADALTLGSAKALTHTAGTLDLASYVATAGSYVSANSNTRVLATGTGTLALAGTGVVYDTSTSTNWSLTGTGTIKLTDSSGTARSITAGTTRLPSLWVSAGTSTTTLTSVTGCIDINMTGMGAGTIAAGAGAFAIGGSVTFVAAGTWSYTGALTFDATGTGKTITSAGKAWTSGTVTFSGSGGGWTLQDAPVTFTSGNALTVAVGHLNTNGFATSTPALVFSGAGVRELTLGASVVSLTGTGAIFDASGTNQTVNGGTSILDQTDASSALKTIDTGGKTFATIRLKKSGANKVQFAGGGTFGLALAA